MAKRREPRDCGLVLRFSGEADFVKAVAELPHSKVTLYCLRQPDVHAAFFAGRAAPDRCIGGKDGIRCAGDISALDCCVSAVLAITHSFVLVRGASTDSFLAEASKGRLFCGVVAVVATGDGFSDRVPTQIASFSRPAGVENCAGICADSVRGMDFLARAM